MSITSSTSRDVPLGRDISEPRLLSLTGINQGSPQQVSDRLDHLIAELKTQIGRVCSERPGGQNIPQLRNIVCVAHGHILAALALRWAQQPLKNGMRLLMDTAGVAVLG